MLIQRFWIINKQWFWEPSLTMVLGVTKTMIFVPENQRFECYFNQWFGYELKQRFIVTVYNDFAWNFYNDLQIVENNDISGYLTTISVLCWYNDFE